jgi:hypothetical protein
MSHPSAQTLTDPRGLPLGTASRVAAEAIERAVWQLMTFADSPDDSLHAAREADPGWILPLLIDAGFRLGLNHPADRAAAHALLEAAQALEAGANLRERAHLAALRALREGRWQVACRAWDDLLLEWPHDALALHWAHQWDHVRGDSANLRLRPARVLPEWDDADPLFPCVLGLYAFGLAECQQFALAEELGRRAASMGPVPWAVHAVTHVMEVQGRFDDGSAWLRQQQQAWSGGSRFAAHLWWHLALFRLEGLDVPGALRLVDTHLSGAALAHGTQIVDAVALYWRMRLLGVEVDALFKGVLETWRPDPATAGEHSFVDWHVVQALIGAGERAQAEAWVARCAERVMRGDEAARSNQAVARDVGVPLMRALIAMARGEPDAAVRGLYGVHEAAHRLGGSQVQRDLVAQTLMAAAAAEGGTLRHVGRAVLNERCLSKPLTPLTRHWADRLGVALG